MISVKVNKADPTDLYEQVAAEIRRAIADGEAKPGERLPPAKDLAAVLGVNTNTVLRSLRVLRDEGLLEFRRGRGISVAGTPERGAVVQRARELVEFARHQGYRRGRAGRDHRERRLTKTLSAADPGTRGEVATDPSGYDRPGHAGATRPTEIGRDHEGDDPAETASADGIVSVCLGPSGFGPELRICGRRFDSSRGHSDPTACGFGLGNPLRRRGKVPKRGSCPPGAPSHPGRSGPAPPPDG